MNIFVLILVKPISFFAQSSHKLKYQHFPHNN